MQDHPAPFRVPADPAIDVSVVIVSYNTRDVTVQAVGSVLTHAGGIGIEVIVVDNQSSDGSADAIRAAHPEAHVIDSGHNGGYGWGNNIGISQARGRYVLVLNPDAVMHAGTLNNAVSYMDAHPEVGILGAKVIYETGDQQSTLFRDLRLSHLVWRIGVPNRIIRETPRFGDQRYASRGRDTVEDVEVVAGCFMMLPRAVIAEVGAMDGRFFMYSEESEWCWRVRQAGYVVRYNPQITITHYGEVSTGGASPWRAVQIIRSHILYLRFTRSPLAAWAGTLLMWLGEILRGAVVLPRLLSGRSSAAAAIWRARMEVLTHALIRQPKGQIAPPVPAVERQART
jgi:hypothetical protein